MNFNVIICLELVKLLELDRAILQIRIVIMLWYVFDIGFCTCHHIEEIKQQKMKLTFVSITVTDKQNLFFFIQDWECRFFYLAVFNEWIVVNRLFLVRLSVQRRPSDAVSQHRWCRHGRECER